MGTPYIGEIRMVGFAFAPVGWAFCDGRLMSIADNDALFNLIGTTYGGDGQSTFALPDLRGRVPLHMGPGFTQGQRAGEEGHTLTISEMPGHVHVALGDPNPANAGTPVGNTWGAQDSSPYSNAVNVSMAPSAIGASGSSQPHPNLSPFLTLNLCIALVGIFPSRN